MGNFDTTTPLGTDFVSLGDNNIRELKVALAEAFSHEDSTFPGATPGSTPIFIPGFLRGATGSRPTGDSLVSGRLYINTTLGIIERYNGSAWVSVATDFPAGTVMPFYQASPPTGWTAVAVNDKFLRVVTSGGTGGTTGGTVAASTSLAHTHTVASHTHTGPSHTHSVPAASWGIQGGNTSGRILVSNSTTDSNASGDNTSGAGGTGNTGAASPATDSQLSGALAYADVCIGTKD